MIRQQWFRPKIRWKMLQLWLPPGCGIFAPGWVGVAIGLIRCNVGIFIIAAQRIERG